MALPPVLDEENLYKFRTKICERYVKQGKCEFADKYVALLSCKGPRVQKLQLSFRLLPTVG